MPHKEDWQCSPYTEGKNRRKRRIKVYMMLEGMIPRMANLVDEFFVRLNFNYTTELNI